MINCIKQLKIIIELNAPQLQDQRCQWRLHGHVQHVYAWHCLVAGVRPAHQRMARRDRQCRHAGTGWHDSCHEAALSLTYRSIIL